MAEKAKVVKAAKAESKKAEGTKATSKAVQGERVFISDADC